jgi:hypothetical protein
MVILKLPLFKEYKHYEPLKNEIKNKHIIFESQYVNLGIKNLNININKYELI